MEKPPPLPRFLLLPQETRAEEEPGPVVRRYKLARLGQPLAAPRPAPKPKPKPNGGDQA